MTPKPEINEAILNGLLSAMTNVNNAVMHLVALEPHLGPIGSIEELSRLEDIFNRLRGRYQRRIQESETHA